MSATIKPTRREERRIQTVREIKQLAMEQVSDGGPDAVSLSGIVREMSMSPAAIYRYFANRDALLADLVVDAYDELADFLIEIAHGKRAADDHLDAVLRGTRAWALDHPNAYRLIFQSSIGSGADFAPDRTVPAASRSMDVIIDALAAVADQKAAKMAGLGSNAETTGAFDDWAERTGHAHIPVDVLMLAFLTWTRLHGIISLELGGHLGATGIEPGLLFESEVGTIRAQAARLAEVG